MRKVLVLISVAAVLLAACGKDKNDTPDPQVNNPPPSAPYPYNTIKLSMDGEERYQWTYTVSGNKLTGIKWEQLNTNPVTVISDITAITYTADKLSSIEVPLDGGVKQTYVVSYDSKGRYDKVTHTTSDNPDRIWTFQVEYDADGRIVQLNRVRTTGGTMDRSGSVSYTYDAAGNIVSMRNVTGGLTMDITVKYDSKPNKGYNQPDLKVVLLGEVSNIHPMIWGEAVLGVLSKNNPIEISRPNGKQTIDYTFDADGNITKAVEQNFTLGGDKQLERVFEMTHR